MKPSLIIIGASARAAAMSAQRAGYDPMTIDCFADWDLTTRFHSLQIHDYPHGFPRLVRQFPVVPWMYVGGMENYADIVDEISRDRPLLGNPGSVLRQIRDPHRLFERLREAEVSCPAVRRAADGIATDGTWLYKHEQSAGGSGVQTYRGQPLRAGRGFFQQRVDGRSCSAVYVSDTADVQLIGTTEQLVGPEWPGAPAFRYAGSIGPLKLSNTLRDNLIRVGQVLRHEFHLRGIFGVDVIIQNEMPCVIDVNPRYTASVEVLERALNFDSLSVHISACRGEEMSTVRLHEVEPTCGKAIYYARQPVAITHTDHQWFVRHHTDSGARPQIADIPSAGSRISVHHPVCTVLASAPSHEEVRMELIEFVKMLEARL